MSALPNTRASLLVRLRDPADADAWRQFVEIYAPVVYGYARRRQLQDADAADLTQEVMRNVAGAARRLEYDPGRGSFRSWLFTVARNRLLDFRDHQRRGQGAGGTSAHELLEQQPAREDEALWDEEFHRRLFALAAEQARPDFEERSWSAFWQTAIDGRKPQEVAAALGLSVGAVYIARSRVQARLKERVAELCDVEYRE
ncbi:MAG: RNA polymerase sigma factor [Gemmataceae bacterium]